MLDEHRLAPNDVDVLDALGHQEGFGVHRARRRNRRASGGQRDRRGEEDANGLHE
jgi:hypothetical protein